MPASLDEPQGAEQGSELFCTLCVGSELNEFDPPYLAPLRHGRDTDGERRGLGSRDLVHEIDQRTVTVGSDRSWVILPRNGR